MDRVYARHHEYSKDLVNFVLQNYGIQPLHYEYVDEIAPVSEFDASVGILIVGLIKGNLRNILIRRAPVIIATMRTYNVFAIYCVDLVVKLIEQDQCTSLILLIIFAFITMTSIGYYLYGMEGAVNQACFLISFILDILNEEQSLEWDGLTELNNCARIIINNEDIVMSYAYGDYPF